MVVALYASKNECRTLREIPRCKNITKGLDDEMQSDRERMKGYAETSWKIKVKIVGARNE